MKKTENLKRMSIEYQECVLRSPCDFFEERKNLTKLVELLTTR